MDALLNDRLWVFSCRGETTALRLPGASSQHEMGLLVSLRSQRPHLPPAVPTHAQLRVNVALTLDEE